MLPKWYDTFLIVANTSMEYTARRAVDKETAIFIKDAYKKILNSISIYAERQDITSKMLASYIKSLTEEIKLDVNIYANQSFFSKILNGNRSDKMLKIIELAGKNLADAAISMRRFEGTDETYFLQTKENL